MGEDNASKCYFFYTFNTYIYIKYYSIYTIYTTLVNTEPEQKCGLKKLTECSNWNKG